MAGECSLHVASSRECREGTTTERSSLCRKNLDKQPLQECSFFTSQYPLVSGHSCNHHPGDLIEKLKTHRISGGNPQEFENDEKVKSLSMKSCSNLLFTLWGSRLGSIYSRKQLEATFPP